MRRPSKCVVIRLARLPVLVFIVVIAILFKTNVILKVDLNQFRIAILYENRRRDASLPERVLDLRTVGGEWESLPVDEVGDELSLLAASKGLPGLTGFIPTCITPWGFT